MPRSGSSQIHNVAKQLPDLTCTKRRSRTRWLPAQVFPACPDACQAAAVSRGAALPACPVGCHPVDGKDENRMGNRLIAGRLVAQQSFELPRRDVSCTPHVIDHTLIRVHVCMHAERVCGQAEAIFNIFYTVESPLEHYSLPSVTAAVSATPSRITANPFPRRIVSPI